MLQQADTTRSACIVTFTDERMLPGTQVLIHSLAQHNDLSDVPIIVLSDDPRILDDPYLRDHATHRHVVDLEPYAGIEHKQIRLGVKAYAAAFEAFRDYGFDVNLYLDSDMLCRGSIAELLTPTQRDLRVVADGSDSMRRIFYEDVSEFNSGVMAIGKQLQGDPVVAELIEHAACKHSYDGGDQGTLNRWAFERGIDIEFLPVIYNLAKMIVSQRREDWMWRCKRRYLDDCRLLHFVWHKPWLRADRHFESVERLWHDACAQMQSTHPSNPDLYPNKPREQLA